MVHSIERSTDIKKSQGWDWHCRSQNVGGKIYLKKDSRKNFVLFSKLSDGLSFFVFGHRKLQQNKCTTTMASAAQIIGGGGGGPLKKKRGGGGRQKNAGGRD